MSSINKNMTVCSDLTPAFPNDGYLFGPACADGKPSWWKGHMIDHSHDGWATFGVKNCDAFLPLPEGSLGPSYCSLVNWVDADV